LDFSHFPCDADVKHVVQILMNVRKRLHVNAKNANAKTHGEAMSAAAVEACFT
jgi:hypothetical protein